MHDDSTVFLLLRVGTPQQQPTNRQQGGLFDFACFVVVLDFGGFVDRATLFIYIF